MFKSLRTKLTVLYASLFAAILVVTSIVTYAAVSANAMAVAGRELTTSGSVFERVWGLRAAQLENGAGLLSRDFGFREAVATSDAATIRSALDNLKDRLGIDLAVVIGIDGRMSGAGAGLLARLPASVLESIQSGEGSSGAVMLGDTPYELVSAPVNAPVTMGWVVFATKVDRTQMRSIEQMAAVPLNASIFYRGPGRMWRQGDRPDAVAGSPVVGRFIDEALKHGSSSARRLANGPPAMALVKPLRSIEPGRPVVLLLRYPIARAMAPYQVLFSLLIATSLAGLAALLIGVRALALNITRPILALEAAAGRMARGELSKVAVETGDEIGRLAEGFNDMVARIGERDAERARAAAALESARDQAEAANRAKSSFLANMSHEVRTPLNGVLGVAGVLAGSSLDAAQNEMVKIIQNSAGVLQRVLGDVLDLARVEAGQMQIVEEVFFLEDAVRALAGATEIQCRGKGLSFRLDLDASLKRSVAGDRVRLEQVLGNLLGNAVKFTAEGSITLAARLDDEAASLYVFEVRDTGIGFEPSLAEALFQPFSQADESITRRFSGTGLGLSISRELARAMGGELTASGTPGEGAVFRLALPLAGRAAVAAESQGPVAKHETPAQESDDAIDHAPRVLLADDHETNRTVVRLILGAVGAQLVAVEDGAQALAAFKAGSFDVVLMDLQMPVMDGLTAIRAMRRLEARVRRTPTPILVLSANAMPEHVEAARRAGADGHIAKPITPSMLIDAIDGALSLKSRAPDERQVA